jgi:hypothetical protein
MPDLPVAGERCTQGSWPTAPLPSGIIPTATSLSHKKPLTAHAIRGLRVDRPATRSPTDLAANPWPTPCASM